MKKTKFWLTVFQNVEVFFAVIILVIILGTKLMGLYPYAVKTGSMEPAIKAGSLVFVDKTVMASDIKKGDIIAFKYDDTIQITHRVEQVESDYFVTKGDANNVPDTRWVYKDMLIGIVKFTVPYMGFLAVSMSGTAARIICGAIILLNIGICVILHFIDKKMKTEDEKEKSEEKTIQKDEAPVLVSSDIVLVSKHEN